MIRKYFTEFPSSYYTVFDDHSWIYCKLAFICQNNFKTFWIFDNIKQNPVSYTTKFMFILHISGPFHLNGCPLRRINQIYTIATKTKLDISGVKLPERLNDKYFNRKQLKKPRHTEGEIFDTKKEVCSLM